MTKYFVTAGLAAVVDIGGFMALASAGTALIAAAIVSFLLAAVVNYLASSRYVFEAKTTIRGFLLFLGGASAGLAVNVGITILLVTKFQVAPGLAKATAVGIAFFANFAINSAVVFRRKDKVTTP